MWSMSKIVAASTSLKGSAANIGARELASVCSQIEEAGRKGNLDEASQLLSVATTELDRVRSALESLR
jgi:HPt (histidine-containing phosphotransfer) domain-containing protein